ncbi:non-ribosomal peptide synthetase [Fusarium avenaceum]|nr:non-ribosomal peptide synthetase [Fusarium avenaceum]
MESCEPVAHDENFVCELSPFPGGVSSSNSIPCEKIELDGLVLPSSVINAGWAVTLRLYNGNSMVCFQTTSSDQDDRVVTCKIEEADTLQTISSRLAHAESTLDSKSCVNSYNTTTLFEGEDTRTEHTPLETNLGSKIQVALHVSKSTFNLVYRRSFMSEAEAKNLAATFAHVLSGDGLRQDSATVRDVSISEKDLSQVMRWNSRELFSHRDTLVHEIFTTRAKTHPEALAINAWDGNMTYGVLEYESNALARHLQQQGVRPGSRVLFCFAKSRLAVVSMLAVLKAGGACVPLDTRSPVERVGQIVESTLAKHAVVGGREAAALFGRSGTSICVIDVSQANTNLGDNQVAFAPSAVAIDDPAFCLFTSGSTGVPKGIIIPHSQLCTGVWAYQDRFGVSEETRILQFSSYTFDIAIADVFTALFYGGTLCIPSEEDRMSGLQNYILQTRPNWAILTPTVARVLEPGAVKHCISKLLLTGEPSTESDIDGWVDAGIEVYNVYGPAENTIITTASKAVKGRASNIGYGVNTRTWVADPSSERLVPVGCIGELIIESGHLAPGYVDSSTEASKAFIDGDVSWIPRVPATEVSGTRRFYRTGDLVRYCDDGSLLCIGRADNQVKLGGQRVELGDIEYHIRASQETADVAVFLPKQGPLRNRLTALLRVAGLDFQPQSQHNHKDMSNLMCCPGSLQEQATARLQQSLPSYMIPSAWICIDRFPTSTSGKLDRKALRAQLESLSHETYLAILGADNEEKSDKDVIPAGSRQPQEAHNEDLLLSVCSQVLNLPVDKMPTSRSFIRLGGDSITAIQVSSLMRRSLDKLIKVKDLLSELSLSQVALRIYEPSKSSRAPEIQISGKVALSPIQRLFFETAEASGAWNHYHQSVLLSLEEPRSPQAVEAAIRGLVERHPMLRARFEKASSGEWQQYIPSEIDNTSYLQVFAETLSSTGQEAAMLEARQSLDVIKGPLIKAILFAGDEATRASPLLFIVAHHAVMDLVSWRGLLEELEVSLTTSTNKDELSSLFRESVSFLAWSESQSQMAQRLKPDRVIPLEPRIPAAAFDYWGVRPDENVYGTVSEVRVPLGKAVTDTLLYDCHNALRTEVVDVLLGAVLISFKRAFPGRSMPAVFNEGHGRETAEADGLDLLRTVGWFTIMSPVYVPEVDAGDVVDVVARVKDYRRATPDHGFQYFSSKYLTQAGREAFEHHLPAEILFNYEGRYQAMERETLLLKPHQWHAGEALADQGPDLKRFSLFELSAAVLPDGQLHLTCSWNQRAKHQDRIGVWLNALLPAAIMETASTLKYVSPRLTLADVEHLRLNDYSAIEDLQGVIISIPEVETLADMEDIYPGSPMQDALAMSQSKVKDGAYQVEFTWKVKATSGKPYEVNTERLIAAWQQVVDRHALLRTVVLEAETMAPGASLLQQVVLKKHKPVVQVLDAQDVEAAIELLDDFASPIEKGLLVDKKPPHRLLICTTIQDGTVVKLQVNHVIFDGLSTMTLLRDFVDAYETGGQGRSAASDRRDESLAYWKTYLADATPCLFPHLIDDDLGQDLGRRGSVPVVLDVDGSALRESLKQLGITMPALFQMVWALVLRTYTGKSQSVFGYLASGRDAPIDGIDDAIGPFVSMLVCLVDWDRHAGLVTADIARQIQGASADSMGHQASSLAEMYDALANPDAGPLLNTAINCLPSMTPNDGSDSDASIAFEELSMVDPTEFDLFLIVEGPSGENGDTSVNVKLDYSVSSITHEHAVNIAATVSHILSEFIRDPYRAPSEVSSISGRDSANIFTWNKKLLEPAEENLHDMFTKAVTEHGDKEAVYSWDGTLTYRQLDELASRLSTHLVSLGIGRGSKVPLCFEKSMWAVVSILAVVQAGGCFVLLDPSHPESRISMIMDEIKPTVLLCSPLIGRTKRFKRTATAAETSPQLTILEIDGPSLSALPQPNPSLEKHQKTTISPDDDLYIVFTSGTTGTPKGAVATHRALATGLYELAEACGMISLAPWLRLVQFASYSFDASIGDMFGTIKAGGCICMPREEDRSPAGITAFINKSRANYAGFTPSFASHLDPKLLPTLKVLVMAGEPLSASLVSTWSRQVRLVNMYGPTEGTVCCVANSRVSIGTSASNIGRGHRTSTWIVNHEDHTRLLPVGATGELLIEGHILCSGYLNKPDRTAEVFISSPPWLESLRPNSMLYKTGDLVRYNADGSISFIGRKDTQVKMNGQRFELGEVEHALRSSLEPSSEPIVVELLKRAKQGEPDILVAFVCVGRGSKDPGSEPEIKPGNKDGHDVIATSQASLAKFRAVMDKLRDAQSVACALPLYMMPHAYVPLERLPLSMTGKVDRLALRARCESLSRKQLVGFASSSASTEETDQVVIEKNVDDSVEDRLARMWEKVLGAKGIGRESDFFRVGGNSMAAIALRTEARRYGHILFVADIFANPKLADMAKILSGSSSPSSSSSSTPSQETPGTMAKLSSTSTPQSIWTPISSTPASGGIGDIKTSDLCSSWSPEIQQKPSTIHNTDEAARACGLAPEQVEDVFPCTPMQEAFVALSSMARARSSYALHAPFQLPLDLNKEKFRSAWESTVRTHAILRSRMVTRAGGSLVVIGKDVEPVQQLTVPDVKEYLEETQRKGFKSGAPLCRLALVHDLGDDRDYFILSAHHAVYDGWSIKLIWSHALALYRNGAAPNPGPRFREFAEQLDLARNTSESEEFWRQTLRVDDDDGFQFPETPVSHTPASRESKSFRFHFHRDSTAAGATAASYIQAAWAIVLSQYSASRTVTFGATLSGRDFPMTDIEYVAGPTIATVPRQLEVPPEKTVVEFLEYVQKMSAVALPHQHLGLHRIQALGPAAKQACEFTTFLVVNDDVALGWSLQDVGIVPVSLDLPDVHPYPLLVEIDNAGGDELHIHTAFDPVCIDESLVDRVMGQFDHILQVLCRSASSGPSTKLGSVMDSVATSHVRTVLDWNKHAAEFAEPITKPRVHQLVERMAQEQADSPAISAHDGQLSYGELNQCANELARRIQESGLVTAESPFVGVLLERSATAVVAMLAVLKAGGAFVPLNPSQPLSRLASLVQEANIKLILSLPAHDENNDNDLVAGLERHANVLPVDLDSFKVCATSGDHDYTITDVGADSPAYLLYTSGTTGKPKGVLMEHGAWSCAAIAQADHLGLSPSTRMLQFSSIAFDASIFEIWGPLYAGGCLCIPSQEERMNDLQGYLVSELVNCVYLTPSVGKLLQPSHLPLVSFAGFVGEPLTRSLVEAWTMPGRRLVNTYGPTEACVMCTSRDIPTDSPHEKPSINIGSALGAATWVMSPTRTTLSPIGAVGELCLESPSLARGYFANLDKTAQSFPSDLLDTLPGKTKGTRLYRTGDMVRYDSDGSLDFLGRRDGQVKLRGQRLELGDISHHIQRFMAERADFREVSVQLFKPPSGGEPYLAAILVMDIAFSHEVLGVQCSPMTSAGADSNLQATVAELKRNIRGVLPHYMVPSQFVAISRLPMGPTGKLDNLFVKTCLGELMEQAHDGIQAEEQDLSENAVRLRSWWSRVLTLDERSVRSDDDFFSLGGNSISAMRLAGLARLSGYRLRHDDIFFSSTLSEMALRIHPLPVAETMPALASGSDIRGGDNINNIPQEVLRHLNVPKERIQDIYPCTPLQESLMAATAVHPGSYVLAESMYVTASQLAPLKGAWAAVFRDFDILRTRIVLDNNQQALQAVLTDQPLEWEEFPDVGAFLKDMETSFVYGKALARVAIINPPRRSDNDEAIEDGMVQAIFGAHHALYDRYALSLIWEKVCQYMSSPDTTTAPAKAITPFKAYVQALLQSVQTDQPATFWREKLAGVSASSFPSIPSRLPSGHQPSARETLEHKIHLPARGDRRTVGATTATVAHAAWALTVSHYTANRDVLFGATLSGREALATSMDNPESIVGPTITTAPFRTVIDYSTIVSEFLTAVQKDVVRAARFGQMGIASISRIDKHCRAACQFGNIFVAQNATTYENEDAASGMVMRRSLESTGFIPVPLVIEVEPSTDESEMMVYLGYDPDILEGKLPHFILDTFTTIVQNLLTVAPDTALGQLPVLSSAHLSALISAASLGNQGKSHDRHLKEGEEECLDRLFRNQADESPSACAIDSWDGQLTYAELDRLSSSLAKNLISMGVGPEKAVCVLFEKSRWAIVAMLGIVKSGGFFVPLDPTYPQQRLEYIVQSVDASVVVTSPTHAGLCGTLPCQALVVSDATLLPLQSPSSQVVPIQPNHSAYVLFTSGSTGLPKGVVIEHHSVCSALLALGRRMGLGSRSRVLQFNSYWFDVMLLDVFGTLIYGGCICIPKDEERMTDLSGWIQKFNVNTMLLSTTVSRLVDPTRVPSLKTVCLTGEAVFQSDLDRWATKVRLIAGYGPTESCIMSVSADLLPSAAPNLIGNPVACQTWIINPLKENELAPFGATGELYIEGPTLARGYLNDEERTAQSFVTGPQWMPTSNDEKQPGRSSRRAYKTGDLVSLNPDGTISFHGRKDSSQVKIRGHRVELAEIEENIRRHIPPSITVCVDLLSSNDNLDRMILGAAFGLGDMARDGPHADKVVRYMDNLTSFLIPALETSLPHHMVPEVYVPLTQLPTLGSGKLDRKTLRSIAGPLAFSVPSSGAVTESTRQQPDETWREKLMRGFWAEAIGLQDRDSIGKGDNFLGLGGDSIAAIKLAALISQHGASLSVPEIFTYPTLEAMSGAVKGWKDQDTALVGRETIITPTLQHQMLPPSVDGPVPCTEYQEMFLAGSETIAAASVGQFVFRLDDSVSVARLQAAFNHCADWFPNLRTCISRHKSSSRLVHTVSPTGTEVSWSCITSDDGVAAFLARDKDLPPLSLGSTLHRVALLISRDLTERRLVWTLNHAAYDAWSIRMMLGHIEQAYLDPNFIPHYPLGWDKFAQQAAGIATTSKSYWSSYLSDIKPAKLLFNYASLQDLRQDRMTQRRISLPRRERKDTTTAAVIVAGWSLLLARLLDCRDIVIPYLVTGRSLPLAGIEICPGPTIAKVPLRMRLPNTQTGEPTLTDMATLVARELVRVIPHEHSGISAIREFVPLAAGTQQKSQPAHAGHVLGRLPLDLVIHHKGNLDFYQSDGLGMRQEQVQMAAPPFGGLSAECAILNHEGTEMDITVLWDHRAAAEDDILELIGLLQDVLAQN